MIFVTVGTQLAFDRLIVAADQWALDNPSEKVFAQIGPAKYTPQNIEYSDFVAPDKADELFRQASLIVSHAGMGSILTALKYRKPIVIMPRRAILGEHRNDHQLATAKWLGSTPGVKVAEDEVELAVLLNNRNTLNSGSAISDFASSDLITRLQEFIHSN